MNPTVEAGSFIEVDGVRTHYHDGGSGPTVLLLHGAGPGSSAWGNWRLLIPELLSGPFRVIAPDQLGYGQTDAPAHGRYGRKAWTQHVIALLDALDVPRVSIVGNSMGGAIALSIAAAIPTRVDRLVVMATCGVPMELTPGLDTVWGYTPGRRQMRQVLELMMYDDELVTDDLVEARFTQSANKVTRTSFESMFPSPRQRWVDDLALDETELSLVTHPTLLVHGQDDEVAPLEASLDALRLLPNATLHVFGQCGHLTLLEQTDGVIDSIQTFLRPVSTPTT